LKVRVAEAAPALAPHARGPKPVDVVCGVVWRNGRYLLAQRPEGRIWAGWWEFPGGKIEAGESAAAAMARELQEELGIRVTRTDPWLLKVFDYPHARVRLHFFHVRGWRGEPDGLEGQRLHWQTSGETCSVGPLLPANVPILRALEMPPLLPVSPPPEVPHAIALARVGTTLAKGHAPVANATASPANAGGPVAGWLQVRRGALEAAQWADWVSLCRTHGLLPIANVAPDTALALGAEALHLSASRLANLASRPQLPLVGASVHTRAELEHASALGLDYVILGSVQITSSHPGVNGLGWQAWADIARWASVPVYAIGGLAPADLELARTHGASGVAMIGSAWGPP